MGRVCKRKRGHGGSSLSKFDSDFRRARGTIAIASPQLPTDSVSRFQCQQKSRPKSLAAFEGRVRTDLPFEGHFHTRA
eukprot:scaffold3216_cov30-Tisochrysis_lutea.AAC.2